MGSSPAQPAGTGKEPKPGCPPAPTCLRGARAARGKGNPPAACPGRGSFPELSFGLGVPSAGFGRLGGLAGEGGCCLLPALGSKRRLSP